MVPLISTQTVVLVAVLVGVVVLLAVILIPLIPPGRRYLRMKKM